MNKEKIKIGILGCGRVCEHYIKKILISEKVGTLYQVIACCDVDEKKSTYVGNIFSCRSYNNIEKFVKHKEMEVVVILTKLINNIIDGGYDTVCASVIEQRSIWLDTRDKINAIGDNKMMSRSIKPEKIHINLFGLGAVTFVDNIRNNTILTNNVGLSPVPKYPYSFQIDNREQS